MPLLIPRNQQPFYIGKGTGDRYLRHLRETASNTENHRKFNKIQSIRKNGLEPLVIKILEGLAEQLAYDIECRLIAKYGRIDFDLNGILTNVCSDNRPPRLIGEANPFYGQTQPDWVKQRLSEVHRGKTISEEHRQAIVAANKGSANHMFGNTHTTEARAKISQSHSKPYVVVSPDGQTYHTNSLKTFCKEHGLGYSSMPAVSTGRMVSHRNGWKCQKAA